MAGEGSNGAVRARAAEGEAGARSEVGSSGPAGAAREDSRVWLAAVLLAAAAAHAAALGGGFVLDDLTNVLGNRFVESHDFGAIFASDLWAGAWQSTGYYRPLLVSSFALDHALAGFRPLAFHATNVLLHLAAVALLFLALRRIGLPPWAAAGAALLFGIHPLQTESISGVSNRGDPLVAAFALAMLLAHRARGAAPAHLRPVWWAAASLAYAAACSSKESGVLALALIVGSDVLVDERGDLAAWWRRAKADLLPSYAAYAAVLGAYLAVRVSITGGLRRASVAFLDNPLASQPAGIRVFLAFSVLGRYLRLLVWPGGLSADRSFHALPTSPAEAWPDALLGLAAAGAIAWGIARCWRRRPIAAWGLCWTAATLLLTSNLPFPVDAMMAERFLYLPLLGLAVATGDAARHLRPSRGRALVLAAAAGAVLVALGVRSAVRHRDWRDQESLFAAAARVSPRSARVHFMLARLRENAGDLAGADGEYERAIRIWPGYAEALSDRAAVLSSLGRHEEAIASARRAADLVPLDGLAWNNLGVALLDGGVLPSAREAFERAIRVSPPSSPHRRAAETNLRIVQARLRR